MEHSPLERCDRDPRIEEYLDRIASQLPRRMSVLARQEQRAELAAHLDALVDAYVELGAAEDEAVLAALERFGPAEEWGRQLSREWKRSAHQSASSGALAVIAAVCAGGVFVWALYPEWPAIRAGALTGCLDLGLPCLVGCFWSRRGFVGSRWPRILMLAGLLAGALLPLEQQYPTLPALHVAARLLLFMKWMVVGGSAAGLTTALQALTKRWQKRQLA